MKVITIGRNSQNNVKINDPKVSRHHCQIVQYDNGSYGIVDFGSTNGTYVNGQRIFGEVRLNPNDVVRIGSNTLQWRRYFNSVDSPIYPQKKSSYLPIILGGVGGVLVLVVIALLLILRNDDNNTIIQQQHSPVQHQFSIDGVNFGFDMTLEDIRQENNVYVTKHEVESNENDDAAAYYYQGYDYYIVNNNTAVTINEETQNVKFFCTRSKNYYTSRNIHVGSTWSELENAYPNLKFYTDFLCFNYFSHTIEEAIIATDQNGCVSFIFYTNQFTKAQIDAIRVASNPSDFDTDIDVSAISISVLQSIRSSIVIEQIEVWDCNYTNTKTVSSYPMTKSEPALSKSSSEPASLPATTKPTPSKCFEFYCCSDIEYVIPKIGETRMDPHFYHLFASTPEARSRLISNEKSVYNSFVFISFCWDFGERGRGKIVNVTNDTHKYKVVYTDEYENEYSEEIEVLPRTFSRMLPKKIGKSIKISVIELS